MSTFAGAAAAFLTWKPVRLTLLGLVAFVGVAAAALYGVSEWKFARTYDVPKVALRAGIAATAERGAHLGVILSCQGCHGTHGRAMFDVPVVGRIVAPDLARVAAQYSEADFATLLRTGVKRDGRSALIMPGDAYSSLADSDVAALSVWFHGLKPDAETETQKTAMGPVGRVMAVMDQLPFSAAMPHDPAPPIDPPAEPQLARGEYLVKTTCNHCHAMDAVREVEPGLEAPPVRPMVQGYSLEEFAHLMRTGKAVGDRELRLMSEVARDHLSHLTDQEVADIHAFLNAPPP